uniref:Uncharacterized protein n=1 Tax=Rhipicephalus pulchellus TaxID=72859 RepID=L7LZF5_RHIPC
MFCYSIGIMFAFSFLLFVLCWSCFSFLFFVLRLKLRLCTFLFCFSIEHCEASTRPTYLCFRVCENCFQTFIVLMGFELKHLSFLGRVKCLTRTKHWFQGFARKTKKQNESAALLPRDMRHTLSGSVAMF